MNRSSQERLIGILQNYTLNAEYNFALIGQRAGQTKDEQKSKDSDQKGFFDSWWTGLSHSFVAYAQESVASEAKNYRCIYGGWPSIAVIRNGISRCLNPNKVDNFSSHIKRLRSRNLKQDQELIKDIADAYGMYNASVREVQNGSPYLMAYLEGEDYRNLNYDVIDSTSSDHAKTCDPQKKGDIICNPVIFGRYPLGDGRFAPICVPGDANGKSYHTTYTCQQVVESLKKRDPAKYEQMLDEQIRMITRPHDQTQANGMDEVSASRSFYQSLRSMYQMCMCSETPSSERDAMNWDVNQEYAHRMFYSRTCVGTVNQVESVLKDVISPLTCNQATQGLSQEWLAFVRKAHHNLSQEGQRWRDLSRLDNSGEDPFLSEEIDIKQIRLAAIEERGADYCNIDMELEDVAPQPIQEEGPKYSCRIKSANWNPDAETTFSLNGSWEILNNANEALNADQINQAGLEITSDNNAVSTQNFTFLFLDRPQLQDPLEFSVSINNTPTLCQLTLPQRPAPESAAQEPEQEDDKVSCSIHLTGKQIGEKTQLSASIKVSENGEEKKLNDESLAEYEVSYYLLGSSKSAGDEEMVSDSEQVKPDSESPSGEKLGQGRGKNFKFELEGPSENLSLLAKLTGPHGCETEKNFEVPKNIAQKNEAKTGRGAGRAINPALQQAPPPRPMRPPQMLILKGNN